MSSIEQAVDKLRRASQRMTPAERAAAPELQQLLGGLTRIQAAQATLLQLLPPLRRDAALTTAGEGEGLAPLLTPKYGAVFKVRRGCRVARVAWLQGGPASAANLLRSPRNQPTS